MCGCSMRRTLLAMVACLSCVCAGLAQQQAKEPAKGQANVQDGPPPLNFAPPPLTPEQQAEVVRYRTYLSSFIGAQIDLAEVDSLVKQAGDMMQVNSVRFKIRIGKSGQLLSRRIDMSCGYEPIDAMFLAALEKSKPFAPPPKFLPSPPEEIDATFTIVRTAAGPQ